VTYRESGASPARQAASLPPLGLMTVAAMLPQHPLPQHLNKRMLDIARIAFISEAGREILQILLSQVHLP
jgi:hypothetical protein